VRHSRHIIADHAQGEYNRSGSSFQHIISSSNVVSGVGPAALAAANLLINIRQVPSVTDNLDFGKTPTQVGIQKLNLDASRAISTQHAHRQSFRSSRLLRHPSGQRNFDVAKETVAQFTQHLDQAKVSMKSAPIRNSMLLKRK